MDITTELEVVTTQSKHSNPSPTAELLRNIHYTLNVVFNNAFCEEHWADDDFAVALKWTAYCEKVFMNYSGKPVEKLLNNYIEDLVSRIKRCYIPNADLYFLKFSTMTFYFLLLQNTEISFENYALALEKFAMHGFNSKVLEMPLNIIRGINSFLEVLGIGDSNIFSYDQWILLGAGLLLQNLMKRCAKEKDSTNSEINLRYNLNVLRRNKTRLMFLLSSSKERKLSLSKNLCKKLQRYIINWCVDEMIKVQNTRSSSESFSDLIIQQPPALLSALALKDKEFFQEYLKALVLNGQKLEPHYYNLGFCWKNGESKAEFTSLVDHFHSLLTNDCNISAATKQIFIELSKCPGGSLWDDIYNECLIRNDCLMMRREA